MTHVMESALKLAYDALPFALPLAIGLWLITMVVRGFTKSKRVHPIVLLIMSCYIALLLYGTCFSRLESFSELFVWERDQYSGIDFQLTLSDSISATHFLFNVLLFVPWGFLGMFLFRRGSGFLLCALSAVTMSALIETFQLYHGLSFDLGDLVANSLGGIIGCALYVPVYAFRKRKQRH